MATVKSALLEDASKLLSTSAEPRTSGRACSIGVFLKSLTPQEHEVVEGLIDNPKVLMASTQAFLFKHGLDISLATIRKHRGRIRTANGCKCPMARK
jgi:hypothetical protein